MFLRCKFTKHSIETDNLFFVLCYHDYGMLKRCRQLWYITPRQKQYSAISWCANQGLCTSYTSCKYRHFRLLKTSTKIVVLEKNYPLGRRFLASERRALRCFSAKFRVGKRKNGRFASQINWICNTKRPPWRCKTIGIAVQNDRFYNRARIVLLHTSHRKPRNTHAINCLTLLTHTWRKTDYEFYFSFFGYSQRGSYANIVHIPLPMGG